MKKRKNHILLGIAAVLLLVGIWRWNTPQTRLLENDGTASGADAGVLLPEEQIPLSDLPEEASDDLDEIQAEYVREVLTLVNAEREKAGLPALELDSSLQQAAQTRAAECVGKFSHTRPNGTSYKTAITEAGLEAGYTGENVATGYTSAQHVMTGWMRSSGHKANILNKKFTKIGIGLEKNTGNRFQGYAWSQLFVQ